MLVAAVVVVIVDERQPDRGTTAIQNRSDNVIVLDPLTLMARPEVPDEERQTRNDYQPDSRENRDDSTLHMEESGSATPVISRDEGRIAEDFGDCYWLPTGICVHDRGCDIAGS